MKESLSSLSFDQPYKHLKLVSATFYQIFVFPPNDSPSKTEKCLFHQKSSFGSRDIYFCIFFPSFPHFPDTKGQMEVE